MQVITLYYGYTECIKSLPNNKFLDWSKFKTYLDDKNIMIFMADSVENIVGKGEKQLNRSEGRNVEC